MLKRSEIAKLLALVASLERARWSEDEFQVHVEAWHASAVEFEWPSFDAAARALVIYRNENPDYLVRPGHITQVLKRVHDEASSSFVKPDIPKEIEDDLRASQAFVAAQVKAHHDRVMHEFASGTSKRPMRAIEG